MKKFIAGLSSPQWHREHCVEWSFLQFPFIGTLPPYCCWRSVHLSMYLDYYFRQDTAAFSWWTQKNPTSGKYRCQLKFLSAIQSLRHSGSTYPLQDLLGSAGIQLSWIAREVLSRALAIAGTGFLPIRGTNDVRCVWVVTNSVCIARIPALGTNHRSWFTIISTILSCSASVRYGCMGRLRTRSLIRSACWKFEVSKSNSAKAGCR